MRSSIVLSGKRDPDLIALYRKVGNSEFQNLIKDALRMIVYGGYWGTKRIPEGLLLQGNPEEGNIKLNLIITSEKDEDVRELLSHILPGKMGTFVKQALRFYLGPATVLSGFMDNEFSGKLQANPVPVQIFAIGDIETKRKKPKKKTVRNKKTKVENPTSTNRMKSSAKTEESFVASSFSQINDVVLQKEVDIQTKNVSSFEEPIIEKDCQSSCESVCANSGNEDDEMLALLEGLL